MKSMIIFVPRALSALTSQQGLSHPHFTDKETEVKRQDKAEWGTLGLRGRSGEQRLIGPGSFWGMKLLELDLRDCTTL